MEKKTEFCQRKCYCLKFQSIKESPDYTEDLRNLGENAANVSSVSIEIVSDRFIRITRYK